MITVSNPTNPITVSTPVKEIIVVSGIQGIPGVTGATGARGAATITELADVNLSVLVDGSLLVYNATSSIWNSTKNLDKQVLECGQF